MLEIRHDVKAHRFVVQLEGQYAELVYEVGSGVMSITHTRVPAKFRGRGVAAELMKAALDYARSEGLSVNPACAYAAAFMRRQATAEQLHEDELLDEALDESFPASDPPAVGGIS